MTIDNLSICIVSENESSRVHLREILKVLLYKETIRQVRTPQAVAGSLPEGQTHFDVVFLAYSLGLPAIKEFMAYAKSQPHHTNVVVTIDHPNKETMTAVADLYMDGIAGFISEPFSAEELSKLLVLVRDLTSKAEDAAKERKALNMLLKECMNQLGRFVEQARKGESGGYAARDLKALSSSLQKFFEKDSDSYVDQLEEIFKNAKPAPYRPRARAASTLNKPGKTEHPGVLIREIMKTRGLNIDRIAEIVRIERADFQLIIDEQKSIDEHSSREIARVLGRTAREWRKMQKDFDEHQARKIKQEAEGATPLGQSAQEATVAK